MFPTSSKKTYVLYENRRTGQSCKEMKAKDHATLIVASNADGSQKLPMCMIGSAKEPHAFAILRCPLPYLLQNKDVE